VTRWYPLQSADEDFLRAAPHVFTYQKRFAAPPQTVWESLTSDESIAAWGSTLKSVNWTSPRPFGVGTTREVAPPVGPRLRERYFLWDEGRRHAFAAYESTAQVFHRFAEDYLVEPDGSDTLFTWVVALEPNSRLTLPVKVLAPAIKALFGKMPSDGQRYWAKNSRRA